VVYDQTETLERKNKIPSPHLAISVDRMGGARWLRGEEAAI
jgi:hypothetical protein